MVTKAKKYMAPTAAKSALQLACERIVEKAIPKTAIAADVDILALVELIGTVITRIIESCAQNFPPMAADTEAMVRKIASDIRSPGFLTRIRVRIRVADELATGFFAPYAGAVAREALSLAGSDEQLTRDVVREVVSPGPLRPDFGF